MKLSLLLTLHFFYLVTSSKKQEFKIGNNLSNRFKRQENECGSSLQLIDCDFQHPLTFSRREENRFRSIYKRGDKCDIEHVYFDWILFLSNETDLDFANYYNKDIFIIKPYAIGTGDHAINLFIREIHKEALSTSFVEAAGCTFIIRPELPIPQITGGSEITVNSGEDFTITEESIDVNVAPGEPGNLEFKWSCTVTGTESEFCNTDLNTDKGYSITIPASETKHGSSFTVTLSVKAPESDWQDTQQVVHFRNDVAVIRIRCLRNCPLASQKTNSKEHLILKATCVKHCDGITKDLYEWAINIPGFDYQVNTKSGRYTNVFHINANILEPGKKYKVSVSLLGISGGSSLEINVHVPPKLGSCSVTPNSGQALKTKFTAKCKHPPGEYTYEIYSVQNDINVIIEKGVRLEELPFSLGPGSKAKVKIFDTFRFADEQLLDITVTSLLQTKGSAEDMEKDILNKYFDVTSEFSMQKLMEMNNFEMALQVANSLASEMEELLKSGERELAKKYSKKLLDFLGKMPMDTSTRCRQLGALAARITETFSEKPDPEIAVLASRICKESADTSLKRLRSKRFPESFSEETKETASTLSKCSQAALQPNLDVLEAEIKAPEISTPFPLVTVPAIVEDYPDYVDDQNTSKAMNEFDEVSRNLIGICATCSKQLAVEMSLQEETSFMHFTFFNLTATVKIGSDIVSTVIESQRVILVPSPDFARVKTEVHVAMCTSTRNVFWWIQKEDIFTTTAIIDFSVNDRQVTKFKKPYSISFETKTNILSEIKSHKYKSPKVPGNDVPQIERDFEKLSVHRITAFSRQSFIIEFEDIPSDIFLDVFVADFHKPSFGEFQKKSTEISSKHYKLYITNKRYYDSWYYLVIYPSSKMNDRSVEYKFSVYTLACYRWSSSEAKWKFACASTSNSTKWFISCECYQSSAMAAKLINNDVREEETLIEELELETQASYIILVSLVLVFIFYCLFFTWFSVSATKEVLEPDIYFLGDVPSSYRYGYVLVVKTGNKSNAGTTSNVTIKIYGNKSESKEHVLNYPDPEMKFLQKNEEDCFFIGTEFYLGDIEKIDIWFDSIGYRPAWFCSDIEIFDLQRNKHWFFEINKWFEILKNERIVYTAFPNRSSDINKDKFTAASHVFKKVGSSFRGPHMWNLIKYEGQSINRMKRLHIIYSIFLTTYCIALYLYGCPKMENSDSLSYTLNYKIDKTVIFVTIACFVITFAIHFPVVWMFRYPKEIVLGGYQKTLKNIEKISSDILCWIFLVANIIISMTLLIILGFWVPQVTDTLWLTSIVSSLLVYIFILENMTRLIINFTTNQKTRVQKFFTQIYASVDNVEKQRSMLYKNFGGAILRPFFNHLYTPLTPLKIKEQKYWAAIKEKLWEILEDLVMITIYVTLLYLVILMDRDKMTYISHLEMKELVTGVHCRSLPLDQVFDRGDMQYYINDTLIFSMQSLQWYGKYVSKNPGMTIDNANKYLGVARLRQHRTHNKSCSSNLINKLSCHPSYLWHSESRNFSEGWLPDILSNRFSRMNAIWDYTDKWRAGTVKYVGTFGIYPGGGYIAPLGRTMQNSIVNWNYLYRNKWIDDLTRNIFIEFLLYNPCTNLFNSVRIKFEISAMGYIKHELNVHTAKLLFVREETGLMVWTIFSAFIVMLTILIIKLTHRLVRKRKLLLKDIWHVVDVFIIVMSLTCLGLYVARSKVVSSFLSQLEKAKNNEFVNYFHLMYTERTLTIIAAILVFLATLRLWKLMRFMLIVKVVEKTLIISALPLLCLFLYQLLFVIACTFYGVLKYGDHSYDFRDYANTISNLFIMSLNLYQDFNFNQLKSGIGYLYYSVFMLVMLGIYTVYIAVITISYKEAQFYYSNEEEYNVVNYVKEQYQYYSELAKVKWKGARLRGGNERAEPNKKVYPKDDQFRYAKCLTLPSSKIEAMASVTKTTIRNMKRRKLGISDDDAELIKHTIVNLFRKNSESKDIFLMSYDKSGRLRFVDDNVMLKMEKLVQEFLLGDEERAENERRRKLYKKIVESHEQKMRDVDDSLNIILNVLNVVNIDV